jgi:hypothetical protein
MKMIVDVVCLLDMSWSYSVFDPFSDCLVLTLKSEGTPFIAIVLSSRVRYVLHCAMRASYSRMHGSSEPPMSIKTLSIRPTFRMDLPQSVVDNLFQVFELGARCSLITAAKISAVVGVRLAITQNVHNPMPLST